MKLSYGVILLIAVLLLPTAFGALAPELAVNHEQKMCKTYYPSGTVELPEGWEYYTGNKDTKLTLSTSLEEVHEDWCSRLRYTYTNQQLQGTMKSFYRNWSIGILLGTLVLFFAGTYRIYKNFYAEKKHHKIWDYVSMGLFIVVLIVGLFILQMIVWSYVDPCFMKFC